MLPRTGWIGLRLTTGRLFWTAFASGAAALPLAFVIGPDVAAIQMAMSVPGALLTVHLVLLIAIRFGADWLALPLVSGSRA